MKDPCIDCPALRVDEYGYICDLACGKHTAWINHQAGIKEVVKWIGQEHMVVRPDKNSISQFAPYYIIATQELEDKIKEWGL